MPFYNEIDDALFVDIFQISLSDKKQKIFLSDTLELQTMDIPLIYDLQ